MNKRLLGSIALALFVLTASAAFAAPADAPQQDPEKVLAKVDKYEIREKDIDQVLTMMGPQAAMYDNEQGRRAILDELVAARLFALKGEKLKLDQTPDFKKTLEDFKTQALARAAIESALKDVEATEEDAKKFYDENPDQFTTPEQIHARHILISDDVTADETLKKIQDELKKGTSFDVLAQEYSSCPSAAQGGDLGMFGKGQMDPKFEEAAFALKNPGDVSEPVKTQFGWHIIKLELKNPSTTLPFDGVKPQLMQYLGNEKKTEQYQKDLEALKKEYKLELFLPKEEEPVSPDVK